MIYKPHQILWNLFFFISHLNQHIIFLLYRTLQVIQLSFTSTLSHNIMSSHFLSDAPYLSLLVSLTAALTLLHSCCLHCIKQYVNQLNIICLHLNCHIKCTKCAHNDKKYKKKSTFCSVLAFCKVSHLFISDRYQNRFMTVWGMTMHRLFDDRARPYILIDVKTNLWRVFMCKKALFIWVLA